MMTSQNRVDSIIFVIILLVTTMVLDSALVLAQGEQKTSKKILCLHGGGGNALSMSYAIGDLQDAMPEFEFVFAEAAYEASSDAVDKNLDGKDDISSRLWIPDPPGGKNQPTTDPNFADESIAVLDAIVSDQGPFYGIIGYSQGAAFVPVYLSRSSVGTFQVAITFCGYLTTTHQGILDAVYEKSPFNDIPHLVWMGQKDVIISNQMTNAMAEIFTNPTVVVSDTGGHYPPDSSDPTFEQVASWIRSEQSLAASNDPSSLSLMIAVASVATPMFLL